MSAVRTFLFWVVEAYIIALFARVILSWFPIDSTSPLVPIVRALNVVTEPLLAPVRRLMPTVRAGAVGFDLSPLIVLLVLQIVVIPLIRAL
jgi:YggT family protein